MSATEQSDDGAAHKQPLPVLHPVIGRERLAIEEELLRARELLRDGMAKLHVFFDALRATAGVQSGLLSKLSGDVSPDEHKATLEQLIADAERVVSESESAILGLQLEDVLGQLLDYTRRRADGLSNIAATMAEVLEDVPLSDNDACVRLRHAVAEADRRAGDRVVSQASLGSGDVELF